MNVPDLLIAMLCFHCGDPLEDADRSPELVHFPGWRAHPECAEQHPEHDHEPPVDV